MLDTAGKVSMLGSLIVLCESKHYQKTFLQLRSSRSKENLQERSAVNWLLGNTSEFGKDEPTHLSARIGTA